jgi:hypothetical protein
MRTLQSKIGAFQKVGECLYRYSSNGVYYAWIKHEGKEVKRSLRTTDRQNRLMRLHKLLMAPAQAPDGFPLIKGYAIERTIIER